LTARGIQSGIHYPFPVYELGAHADLGYQHGDCPNAERAAAQQLSLPMYPELTTAQCEQVASAIRSVMAGSFSISGS
jgi:dTDP-4-amino-4,6-dideoxygalactose transaminase